MAKKAQAVESRFGLPLSVASILDSIIGISLLLRSWADARRFLTDPTPKPDTMSFAPLFQPQANVSRNDRAELDLMLRAVVGHEDRTE